MDARFDEAQGGGADPLDAMLDQHFGERTMALANERPEPGDAIIPQMAEPVAQTWSGPGSPGWNTMHPVEALQMKRESQAVPPPVAGPLGSTGEARAIPPLGGPVTRTVRAVGSGLASGAAATESSWRKLLELGGYISPDSPGPAPIEQGSPITSAVVSEPERAVMASRAAASGAPYKAIESAAAMVPGLVSPEGLAAIPVAGAAGGAALKTLAPVIDTLVADMIRAGVPEAIANRAGAAAAHATAGAGGLGTFAAGEQAVRTPGNPQAVWEAGKQGAKAGALIGGVGGAVRGSVPAAEAPVQEPVGAEPTAIPQPDPAAIATVPEQPATMPRELSLPPKSSESDQAVPTQPEPANPPAIAPGAVLNHEQAPAIAPSGLGKQVAAERARASEVLRRTQSAASPVPPTDFRSMPSVELRRRAAEAGIDPKVGRAEMVRQLRAREAAPAVADDSLPQAAATGVPDAVLPEVSPPVAEPTGQEHAPGGDAGHGAQDAHTPTEAGESSLVDRPGVAASAVAHADSLPDPAALPMIELNAAARRAGIDPRVGRAEIVRQLRALAEKTVEPTKPVERSGDTPASAPAPHRAAAESPEALESVEQRPEPEAKAVAADARDVQAGVEHAGESTAKQPQQPPHEPNVPETLPDDPGPELTSARKAMTEADREAMGLDKLASPETHSWQRALTDAKRAKIPGKALDIAAGVLDKPKALSDTETAGLVLEATRLKNMHREALADIDRSTDPAELSYRTAEVNRLEQDFDTLTRALRASGTEKGRALASQKLTIDKDYSLVSVKARAKAAAGRSLTEVESQRFSDLSRRLEESERRVVKLEKQMDDQKADRTVRQHKAKQRMSPEARHREFSDTLSQIRELLKAGC